MKECSSLRVTTLIDNDVWKSGLASTWGLSLYVEMDLKQRRHIILMDKRLLRNLIKECI